MVKSVKSAPDVKVGTPTATRVGAAKKKPTVKKSVKKERVFKPKTLGLNEPRRAKAEEVTSRLLLRVRAYESKILDMSVKQIIDTALRYDAKIQGPIPLPTEIKKYTVNRAAFIYKNAREQFEMRVHKRLIDILNPTPKIIESLTNLSLPSGVNIDVKLI